VNVTDRQTDTQPPSHPAMHRTTALCVLVRHKYIKTEKNNEKAIIYFCITLAKCQMKTCQLVKYLILLV